MRPVVLSLVLLATGHAALAQTPLTAEQFDAFTRGRTLMYHFHGQAYGAERYEADRKVTWSFLDGDCRKGRWYPQGHLICFAYEDRETPQCWTFYAEGGSLRAMFESPDNGLELYEAGETDEDLLCLGPKIGV
ncbi:MAG: hypothetical protein ACK5JR_14155 [Tropicimonas sp.]|uniref:hypothetical protein n=1 Tax=Tropicimonas sp. TaxID=2067044 RepID=UPI003A84D1FC